MSVSRSLFRAIEKLNDEQNLHLTISYKLDFADETYEYCERTFVLPKVKNGRGTFTIPPFEINESVSFNATVVEN